MQRQVKIKLFGESFQIGFPNNGQLIDIETRKAALSNGLYGEMIAANSQSANIALDLIDSFSTFIVMVPEVDSLLKGKTLLEMDALESQEFIVAYRKRFIPFFKSWADLMKQKADELNKLYDSENEV